MAKLHILKHRGRGDKRIALLALAFGQKKVESSSCLADAEMAALVDGTCDDAERKRLQNHLASCEFCYQHWIDLARGVDQPGRVKKDKRSGQLIRFRHVTWAGSFLAAAASLVLFINITQVRPPQTMEDADKTVDEQNESTELQPSVEMVPAGHQSRAPAFQLANRQDLVKGQEQSADTQLTSVLKKRQFRGSNNFDKKNEKVMSKRSYQAENITEFEKKMPDSANILQRSQSQTAMWLATLKQGCQAGQVSPFFWEQQYQRGKKITRFGDEDENYRLQELLPLIRSIDKKAVADSGVCREILRIIDQQK